ncbi:MAG TPA: hypothetical protein VNY05_45160 [Candidatus Acidoferrales bacterium]|nr:hypothetical protein [Candidatus Acidoferrales bacterium]
MKSKTTAYPNPAAYFRLDFWNSAASIFLRCKGRKKEGKPHPYFSYFGVVESVPARLQDRTADGVVSGRDQLPAASRVAQIAGGLCRLRRRLQSHEPVPGDSRDFSFQVDKAKAKTAEQRDDRYLLRQPRRRRSSGVVDALRATDPDWVPGLQRKVTLKNRLMMHLPGLAPAAIGSTHEE